MASRRGVSLIERLVLDYPDQLPRVVLADLLREHGTSTAVARALGCDRHTVTAALAKLGLCESARSRLGGGGTL